MTSQIYNYSIDLTNNEPIEGSIKIDVGYNTSNGNDLHRVIVSVDNNQIYCFDTINSKEKLIHYISKAETLLKEYLNEKISNSRRPA